MKNNQNNSFKFNVGIIKWTFLLAIIFITASCESMNQSEKVTSAKDEIALKGYDPVAYFEQGQAKIGNQVERALHNGIVYQFSSTKNRQLFESNPEKYVPEYGGWCAYAIAKKSMKMEANPEVWKIQDGRLLLFYSDWRTILMGSLLDSWNTDERGHLEKADVNWITMEPDNQTSLLEPK